ncbi:MAG: GAF domain-containing protein [Steroidobacteraceae bacterium]|nr:GAF domain-containing protein [Deltaproteobacteria bacterium]
MKHRPPSQRSVDDNRLSELTLLYQFSNTMLSTIRLNKLTHLILTALTTPAPGLFERSILFLRNEKSEVLQGMLGVTRNTSAGLEIIGDRDALGSRWDISDEVVNRQRSNEFCSRVRMARIEINEGCPLIRQVVSERSLGLMDEPAACHECTTGCIIRKLCSGSFAAAPLIARDKTIGIIVVDNPESGCKITQGKLHFLQLFANQAGMAIENSMLYNQIEETNDHLRDARERLLHGERLAVIGEMAANLAHELKNPIITIGGFARRLLKALPEETREYCYADTIVTEVNRLEKMLTEILAFSRKSTICFSNCDLLDILQDCISSCTTALEDNGISLSTFMAEGSWPLSADPHQLKQVFLNLILNACDAMPNGGRLTISLDNATLDNKSAMVSIQDTGAGIPKEILPRIFSPFFTTKYHGTGLGLAIANRIIISHFGSIEVESSECGATFKVSLPLATYQ